MPQVLGAMVMLSSSLRSCPTRPKPVGPQRIQGQGHNPLQHSYPHSLLRYSCPPLPHLPPPSLPCPPHLHPSLSLFLPLLLHSLSAPPLSAKRPSDSETGESSSSSKNAAQDVGEDEGPPAKRQCMQMAVEQPVQETSGRSVKGSRGNGG
jgi:hypothetical protein